MCVAINLADPVVRKYYKKFAITISQTMDEGKIISAFCRQIQNDNIRD